MNAVGKGVIAFFLGVGVLMVLVGREFADRGGETGNAASVFVMIGMIWTGVAMLLLFLFLFIGRATARDAVRQAELLRKANESSDGAS